MKLITFAVPCYNSAAYMDHCIVTLLQAGEDAEIILINDGSTDDTGTIADHYADQYPDRIRVIHQENGGHGEGVNQGLLHATGLYYKVVDSDDWLDINALRGVMEKLRAFASMPAPVDLLITNYVYEHTADNTQKVMRYTNVFPQNRIFTWEDTHRFHPSQYLLMHSVIYRTQVLRDCALKLPKHTFYVDNIFVYQPLPFVRTLYYLNVDLYRYFIGREDQSVNEKVMIQRVDQQLRVNCIMLKCHNPRLIRIRQPKLGRYMYNYLTMMVTISSIFLMLANTPEATAKRHKLWRYIRSIDPLLYRSLRYHRFSGLTDLPGKPGEHLALATYRMMRRVYKFN